MPGMHHAYSSSPAAQQHMQESHRLSPQGEGSAPTAASSSSSSSSSPTTTTTTTTTVGTIQQARLKLFGQPIHPHERTGRRVLARELQGAQLASWYFNPPTVPGIHNEERE